MSSDNWPEWVSELLTIIAMLVLGGLFFVTVWGIVEIFR